VEEERSWERGRTEWEQQHGEELLGGKLGNKEEVDSGEEGGSSEERGRSWGGGG
jgi:hypothetical protein